MSAMTERGKKKRVVTALELFKTQTALFQFNATKNITDKVDILVTSLDSPPHPDDGKTLFFEAF